MTGTPGAPETPGDHPAGGWPGFAGANGSAGGGRAAGGTAGGGSHGSFGTLTSEAALLLDALALRLAAAQAGRTEARPPEPRPTPCPECGQVAGPESASCPGCPLCRLLSVVRGERPEVTATLVDAAALFVSALRAALPDPAGGPATNPAGGPATNPAPAETVTPPDGPGGVQRIRIE